MFIFGMIENPQPGQLLARGVCRHLRQQGMSCLTEFVPARGLRVDVIALDRKGEIWIIECKSSRADFVSDQKWMGYLEWCDRFFWCVPEEFPLDILPENDGLILADPYDAEIIRYGPETKLPAARRKATTLKMTRNGLDRLASYTDPRPAARLAEKLVFAGDTSDQF